MYVMYSILLKFNQVANTAVRNTGTIAGNLMLKHAHQYFPSDLFLMLETIGAIIVVASATERGKEYQYSPVEWLRTSMERKVITKIVLPALSQSHVFKSYKITPRHVNAHAYVNAGFLVSLPLYMYTLSSNYAVSINTKFHLHGTLSPPFMRFLFTQKSIYTVFGFGPIPLFTR